MIETTIYVTVNCDMDDCEQNREEDFDFDLMSPHEGEESTMEARGVVERFEERGWQENGVDEWHWLCPDCGALP